jgi:lysophospholipase
VTDAPLLAQWATGARAVWTRADDGIRLRVLTWPGDAGTVLVLPGRTEWAEKYAPTATVLQRAGYAVAAIDFRGQGLSDRLLPDPRPGHVGAMDDYQRDLAALMAVVTDQGLPAPHYLFTHSMGGAIGLRALHRGLRVRAAVFSAPMWGVRIPPHLRPWRPFIRAWHRWRGTMLAYAPTTDARPYVLKKPFAVNRLTRDAAMWQTMRDQLAACPDLAVGGPTMQWLDLAIAEARGLMALPAPAVPALIAWGAEERIADRHAMRRMADRWPGATALVFPDARHEIPMETPDVRDALHAATLRLFAKAQG